MNNYFISNKYIHILNDIFVSNNVKNIVGVDINDLLVDKLIEKKKYNFTNITDTKNLNNFEKNHYDLILIVNNSVIFENIKYFNKILKLLNEKGIVIYCYNSLKDNDKFIQDIHEIFNKFNPEYLSSKKDKLNLYIDNPVLKKLYDVKDDDYISVHPDELCIDFINYKPFHCSQLRREFYKDLWITSHVNFKNNIINIPMENNIILMKPINSLSPTLVSSPIKKD